ncbi:MAG: hypothetical protein Q8S73_42945 [Deltaproteobacteria bacterium]|nr:hypothetical protein [Deltaproteobacteria bacterium]
MERHAFKVMQAYSIWLDGTPELKLLQLLGLFDHPIETEVLQMLWQAQIPDLTVNIDERAWRVAIRDLQEKHRLLSVHDNRSGLLDCHPLIREYFGRQLREKQPDVWREAHTRLYEYYKTLPQKEFPDTLEEMQPLFNAVAHGCAADLHQKALDEVYWPRIKRKGEHYLITKLGACSDDLAALAHFFTTPWHILEAGLMEVWQAGILNWVGLDLRALGRLREAMGSMQAGMEMSAKQKDWIGAAQDATNFCELQLILGDIAAVTADSKCSMDYADRSGDSLQRIYYLTTRADALHQAGKTIAAFALFKEAEQLQQELQPEYPYLYSLRGFLYCDLLMAKDEIVEVLERTRQSLQWAMQERVSSLDIVLNQLTFGRVHLHQGDFQEAIYRLNLAVAGFRAAGQNQYLPLGLLSRAALYTDTRNPNCNFARAHQDLQEVYDIAEPSGMRLHLTDYHLEMVRLLIVEKGNPPQSPFFKGGSPGSDVVVIPPIEKWEPGGISVQEHVAQAAKLIEETGYKRRLPELQELQKRIGEQPFS